jgi:hypothetical protein
MFGFWIQSAGEPPRSGNLVQPVMSNPESHKHCSLRQTSRQHFGIATTANFFKCESPNATRLSGQTRGCAVRFRWRLRY